MSLMFAALRKLDNPVSAATLANMPDPISGRRKVLIRRWSLLPAIIGVALLGGWWLYPQGPVAQAAADPGTVIPVAAARTPEAVPATATTTPTTFTPEPTVQPPAVAPIAAPSVPGSAVASATTTAPAPTPAVQAVPDSTKPPIPPAPRQMARPTPEPIANAAINVRDASEATPSTDGQNVARAVAALGTAIHNDDFDSGREQLAHLATLLPPQSLTLLRMQAWFAHESGDNAGALALYRRIVTRMPGDPTAVINLAILEAGNGEGDSARQRLQRLRTRDADSREIERAIGLVEAQLR